MPTRAVKRANARIAIILSSIFVAGCSDVETFYGRRSSPEPSSVNGTRVLGNLFELAGHRVSSSSYLSPKLNQQTDVFVWFPDDFKPPEEKTREWFDTWLRAKRGRVLIYVGRDYDAAVTYWRTVQKGAALDQQIEIAVRLTEEQDHYDTRRTDMPEDEDCDWFVCHGKSQPRQVRTLQGDGPWLAGIDARKLGIELNGRFAPAGNERVLVSSESDALITRRRVGGSHLYVVTNGSFLLNLALVNHEHRKLAGKLIEQVGSQPRRVVFLESGYSDPRIYDKDPESMAHTGLEILGIPPFDQVLLHLAVLGLIFCFARYPIFGRPRDAEPASPSDFGKHVTALGKLLARTRNPSFAQARLDQYAAPRHES